MMTIIEGLHRTWRTGYAHVPNTISGSRLSLLQEEAFALPLEPATTRLNGVEQNFDMWVGQPDRYTMSRIIELGQWLRRQCDVFNGYRWRSGYEVSVQRYPQSAVGIGPHRDAKRFIELIVVVNLAGTAVFSIYDEDRTTVRAGWRLEPGDIVLMEGYHEGNDRRPIHSVSGGRGGERISLTYRMMA